MKEMVWDSGAAQPSAVLRPQAHPALPHAPVLCHALASGARPGSGFRHRTSSGSSSSELGTPLGGLAYVNRSIPDDDAFDMGGDKYLLAKTYFDCHEYRHATHMMQNQGDRKAVFL
jgi:anaphase-promoting complex subunit 8